MRTILRLKNQQHRKLPAEFRHEDLRYPEELVATFLRQYTRPGDRVLDPFAGFGTTLIVAEAMERVPFGIEFDLPRARYVRSLLQHPANLIHGDSRNLLSYQLPPINFSITIFALLTTVKRPAGERAWRTSDQLGAVAASR